MRWNTYLLGAGISLFGLASCNPVERQVDRPAFFDLSAYMDSEKRRLEAVNSLLVRESFFNGSVSQDSLEQADYSEDLRIFRRSDINRPSWRDQYSVDSLWADNGQLKGLRYQALTPSLKTRELEVDFREGEVARIFVYNQTENWISGTRQKLTYWPDSGYLVEAHQRIIWTGKDTLSMRGMFFKD